ncbi:inactive pancreatic lipase-related protein 1-like [Vanessa tameamea]|uniref:Inactive pancreatic lipase-related protein 1-like n=1 Tax=Vanessa tameamea TaxID=334116 RepID=A0A8B8HLR4_VANTA
MQFSKNVVLRSICYFVFILSYSTIIWTSDNQGRAYGDEWLYFVSENGTTHVMNFSSVPNDTQDMNFGDVYFYLYTRNNIDKPENLRISENNISIESLNFNKSNDIRVITHGWFSAENVNWIQKIKYSLLREYDLNVITVDWSELSNNIIYPYAALSTRYIGKRVAKLLDALIKTYSVGGKKIHLIGHSLGAHIMGYAGMFSMEKIHRITGLDPARPLFEIPEISPDYRLDKSDADFVDILHTCGGIFGYKRSYGHADFYPNSGQPMQPGCSGVREVAESCSHGRSHEYFEESIEYKYNTGFISFPCESWKKFDVGECKEDPTSMGYNTNVTSIGNYYFRTRNEYKFAIGNV